MFTKTIFTLSVVLLFIHSGTAASSDSGKCSPRRYVVEFFFKANWHRAAQVCAYHGLQLATVSSEADRQALKTEIENTGMINEGLWLAGTDFASDRKFYWASNGRPLAFTSWNAGQPDNAGGNEHCVHVQSGGLYWNDFLCSRELYFVCEPVQRC